MDKELAIVLIIIGLCLLFLAMPFITGSSFGQRCAKAYPEDPAQQEWLIAMLTIVEQLRQGRKEDELPHFFYSVRHPDDAATHANTNESSTMEKTA